MNILNKPIDSFSFNDIVAFCATNEREGIQLDYKKDLTTGSLSKHFAAFSNTRGGCIIIGVEEDKTTGLPLKCEGISVDAQDIETIRQWANNIDPLPRVIIHPTNKKNGRRFILIRIYEGDDTPYYVQNDGRIWIRTENISKELLDIASPDYSKLLYNKQIETERSRDYYLSRASSVLAANLEIATKDKIKSAYTQVEAGKIYPKFFENADALLTVFIQPNFPLDQLTPPQDLINRITDYRSIGHSMDEFPINSLQPIPDGAAFFSPNVDGITYLCQQVYSQGLIFYKQSIKNFGGKYNGKILVDYLVGKILVILKCSQKFYTLFGYQGTLRGEIRVERVKGVYLVPLTFGMFEDDQPALLSDYDWQLSLDTNILMDDEALLTYYFNLCQKIYWDLGFSKFNKDSLTKYLTGVKLI